MPAIMIIGLWILGTVLAFFPTLATLFNHLQTDPGDTLLNHWILEHSWQWLLRHFPHESFFDAPIFYPATNASSYTDFLLGVAPLYWLFRLVGLSPELAYPFWMIGLYWLNLAAAYWFLKKVLGFERIGSAFGAYLFAFAASRVQQMGHQQLQAQFYPVLALGALVLAHRTRELKWIPIFFAACVLQLYSGFYQGWFLCLFLGVAGLVGLAFAPFRQALVEYANRGPKFLGVFAASALFAALAMVPWLQHYSTAAKEVGIRVFQAVFLPPMQSWFYLGEGSWIYAWQEKVRMFQVIGYGHEQRLGVGLVTLGCVLLGLWRARKNVWVRWLLTSLAVIWLLVTDFRYGITAWKWGYEWIPGAKAVRALPRVGISFLIFYAVGIAYFFEQKKWKSWHGIALFFAILVFENARTTPSFDRGEFDEQVEAIATAIQAQCPEPGPIYYTPVSAREIAPWTFQIQAMWISLKLHRPTLNGFSGNTPPGWELGRQLSPVKSNAEAETAFQAWHVRHGLDPKKTCWIKLSVDT